MRLMTRTVVCVLTMASLTLPAVAASKKKSPPVPYASAICMVADTGLILFERNPDEQRAPASMVKMMLLLLVGEGIEKGTWTLDKRLKVSEHAQAMGGSQLYLAEGQEFTLGELMKAVAVASANDAAMVVAEGLWGSEEKYLKRMNERARELGMKHSEFHSVHGLPPEDGAKPDATTARDMALLGRHCIRHPFVMECVGTEEIQFGPKKTLAHNTNSLLKSMPSCDGLKTGYTRAAGFCLTATARQDDIRLIAVVMGCPNKRERFEAAQAILEKGFASVERTRLLARGEQVDASVPVQNCESGEARVRVEEDVWIVLKKGEKERVRIAVDTPEFVRPPLKAGTPMGQLRVEFAGTLLAQAPVALADDLKPARLRWKLVRSVLRGRTPQD